MDNLHRARDTGIIPGICPYEVSHADGDAIHVWFQSAIVGEMALPLRGGSRRYLRSSCLIGSVDSEPYLNKRILPDSVGLGPDFCRYQMLVS